MGFLETFQNAAKTIVDAFGDVAVSTNYHSLSSVSYDASSGVNTTTYATTGGVKVIFQQFEFSQIDNEVVKATDKQALVPAKNISGVVPKPDDQIATVSTTINVLTTTIASAIVSTTVVTASITAWNVKRVFTDPAQAMWTLHIGKP